MARAIVFLEKTYIFIDDIVYVISSQDFVVFRCMNKNFSKNYTVIDLTPYESIQNIFVGYEADINRLLDLPIGTRIGKQYPNFFMLLWDCLNLKIGYEPEDCKLREWAII